MHHLRKATETNWPINNLQAHYNRSITSSRSLDEIFEDGNADEFLDEEFRV